ncbi:hypothetical protein AB0C29_25165 [Actinoplanes sp. NPDC048791]|uniref:hypothetical protein n=1 Tax=Actinoplanes sp. NPDC048791 TaxID=3154623 RepID=UPI0033C7A277
MIRSYTVRFTDPGGTAADVVAELRSAGQPIERWDGGWTLADGTVLLSVWSDEPDTEVEGVGVVAPSHVHGDLVRVAGGATGEPVLSHTVEPGRGIGVVSLGEPRAVVRKRLHDAVTNLSGPAAREDNFQDDGIVVRYSADDRVERIHVVTADRVEYAGVTVLPGGFDEVRQSLVDAGHVIEDRELAVEIKDSANHISDSDPKRSTSRAQRQRAEGYGRADCNCQQGTDGDELLPDGCADQVAVGFTAVVAGVRKDEQAAQRGGSAHERQYHDRNDRAAMTTGSSVVRIPAREETWSRLIHD